MVNEKKSEEKGNSNRIKESFKSLARFMIFAVIAILAVFYLSNKLSYERPHDEVAQSEDGFDILTKHNQGASTGYKETGLGMPLSNIQPLTGVTDTDKKITMPLWIPNLAVSTYYIGLVDGSTVECFRIYIDNESVPEDYQNFIHTEQRDGKKSLVNPAFVKTITMIYR